MRKIWPGENNLTGGVCGAHKRPDRLHKEGIAMTAHGVASSFMERLTSLSSEPPECPICNERYDPDQQDFIPRNLSCGHSMCSRCIGRYMSTSGKTVDQDIVMMCPSKCSRLTTIPHGDIQNLSKNFPVMEMVHTQQFERSKSHGATLALSSSGEYYCDVCEVSKAEVACPSCAVSLCFTCSAEIHQKKGYQVHKLMAMSDVLDGNVDIQSMDGMLTQRSFSDPEVLHYVSAATPKMCRVHSSELVEYLCLSCSEEVCKKCHLVDGHRGHECRLLKDVAQEKREALRGLLAAAQETHSVWNKGFDRCQELREVTNVCQNQLETSVRAHFAEVRAALDSREERLLREVGEEMERRDQLLSSQADHLAKVCEIAKDLCKEVEELIESPDSQMVHRGEQLAGQVQQYIRSEQDTNPLVSDSILVQFNDKGELLQLAERLGELKLPPGRVEGVRIQTRGPSEAKVSWDPLSSPSISAYLLEVSSGGLPYRVVYEGPQCEYDANGVAVEEDVVYYFRVAAVNDVGIGPYSVSVGYTKRKACFLWDPTKRHSRAHISNGGYTVSIGENATWVSVGANTVLSHGRHYWEVVLEKYGTPSLSRKVVVGVVAAGFQQWHRSHGVIGIKTCPIGSRSWGLACGTAKKLAHGSTFFNSLGRKHNLFREGDAVGVMLDLSQHIMSFYRNGKPLGITFVDVYGPVVPAVSFCRHKTLTLRFPSTPPTSPAPSRQNLSSSCPGPSRHSPAPSARACVRQTARSLSTNAIEVKGSLPRTTPASGGTL